MAICKLHPYVRSIINEKQQPTTPYRINSKNMARPPRVYFAKYTESSINANKELVTKQAPMTKIAVDMFRVKFTVALIAKHLPNRNIITENPIMNPVGRIK